MGEVSFVAPFANASISKLLIDSQSDRSVRVSVARKRGCHRLTGASVKIGKVPRQGRKGGNDCNPRPCVFSSPAFFELLPRLQDTCRRDTPNHPSPEMHDPGRAAVQEPGGHLASPTMKSPTQSEEDRAADTTFHEDLTHSFWRSAELRWTRAGRRGSEDTCGEASMGVD